MKLSEVKKLKVVDLRGKLKERGLDTKGLKADLVARLWTILEQESVTVPLQPNDGDLSPEKTCVDDEVTPSLNPVTFSTDIAQAKEKLLSGTQTQVCAVNLPSKQPNFETKVNATLGPKSGIDDNVTCLLTIDQDNCTAIENNTELQVVTSAHPPRLPSPAGLKAYARYVEENANILADVTHKDSGNLSCPIPKEVRSKAHTSLYTPSDRNKQEKDHADKIKSVNTHSVGSSTPPLRSLEQGQRIKRQLETKGRSYYEFKEEVQYIRAKIPQPICIEDHEVNAEQVELDPYNSDLHFRVGLDGKSGQPLLWEKFPLLWSGCRLSHGVRHGSVSFEVKYETMLLPPPVLDEGMDPHAIVLRVGWSADDTSLQLGDTEFSYGFDSRGYKVTQGLEEPFGEPFTGGDTISCYAVFSETSESELSFYKNGHPMGVAFQLELSHLNGRTFYPHILTKNCSVSVNLDPQGAQWFCGPSGFTPLCALQPHLRIRAPQPPATREESEVVLMVGMPGSGKTHWALNLIAKQPEKRYNLLSTDTVLACMKGVWAEKHKEVVVQQATQCLTHLIRLAASKRRNYILDQTNIYASARQHKMLLFRGFHRRAIILFPPDEEWQRRLARQHQSKRVPEESLSKVKASFTLPQTGDLLEEVVFVGLSHQEADRVLAGYKEEARLALPKRKKRRHKGSRAFLPRWNPPYRTSHAWTDWRPNGPVCHWNPMPRQVPFNSYNGGPGHYSATNYMYGAGQLHW